MRCFKCLKYGYVTGKCCSKADWSKKCFKCEVGPRHLAILPWLAVEDNGSSLLCRGDQDIEVKWEDPSGHTIWRYDRIPIVKLEPLQSGTGAP